MNGLTIGQFIESIPNDVAQMMQLEVVNWNAANICRRSIDGETMKRRYRGFKEREATVQVLQEHGFLKTDSSAGIEAGGKTQ